MNSEGGIVSSQDKVRNHVSENNFAIDVRAVKKTFASGQQRTEALKDLSVVVRHGMITGLIGPDAAGKTTLMRLAAGLLLPDAGEITVLGLNSVTDSAIIQASIGYMPQRFGLYEDLTVKENLDLYADLHGVPVPERPDRYQELHNMTGLGPVTSRLAGRLSGGMKQKLGLACSLIRRPSLLMLDEPTVGVDPLSRRELWAIISRLVREKAVTVFLSTSYLDEAGRCNEVILLHQGIVLNAGPPQALLAPVENRTYIVKPAGPKSRKRKLQEELARNPQILDVVVQGDNLRLISQSEGPLVLDGILPEVKNLSIEPVEPRIEDGFVALIKTRSRESARPLEKTRPAASLLTVPGPVIEVKDLERRFGDFYAVKRLSFTVESGEIFGLLGPNGAGKSTTFRMLCGLMPPSGGTLKVAGVDLRRAAARARGRIGYMSQRFSLYANLSVKENLDFFAAAYGLKGQERADRTNWALQEFMLQSSARSGDLPLGYKQRLALACALMHEPDIVFLDEPTSGVDPVARREFWDRINILADGGVTTMVTTHFMEEAEYCDRVAIMDAGEVLAIDSPGKIKAGESSEEIPNPTMEDAFVSLIERHSGHR